jgi:ATP-dependent DNA helicase RecG
LIELSASVQYVRGVGPERAAALAKSGVATIEDLLYYLPFRYEDRRTFAAIRDLAHGMRVSVSGTIAVAGLRRARRVSLYEAQIEDDTGRLKALWFNQPFLRNSLERGARVVLYGTVERDPYAPRRLMMSSPQWEVLEEDAEGASIHTGRIVPVYEKLGVLGTRPLRRILTTLVRELPDDVPDPLPADVREHLAVGSRAGALREVHAPADVALDALNAARSPGHRRLILEELFLFQLGLALRREVVRETRKGVTIDATERAREAVKKILPFHLTAAQKRVLREIADDMRAAHPMNRLVQGDVGCGKTMVALLSMSLAVESDAQAAFMAPTEILAEQHHLTFRRLLQRVGYKTELLTAAVKGKERAAALARIASGEAQIAVGTHALIQDEVRFHKLRLAVVDEQHRFGVLQRRELTSKGTQVDVLVMTATPIPRTLALTAYGDLDVSIVDERPPGRQPVRTLHRASSVRREVIEMARREIAAGHQVYVVYPLVEESEKLEDVQAATAMYEEWQAALPRVRVGLLHGKMKSAEKEAVMASFASGETSVLVATTVIEVGMDVPNATLMIIEHAERFGLAQLHQLRGRVGRGPAPSSCVLLTSGRLSDEAKARMAVMVETEDGFVIAERDLEIRGPGDFFGTRQSGLPTFRVANLVRDRALLEAAREEAFRCAAGWKDHRPPEELRAFLEEGGWERRFRLARVG